MFGFLKKKTQLRKYYRADGSVERESYWLNGRLHRTDGPAVICYRPDGSVRLEEYWLDDQQHRTDGPAIIWYRPDGSVESEDEMVRRAKSFTKKGMQPND